MHRPLTSLLLVLMGLSVSFAQRSNQALVCKRPVLTALKPMPKLSYQCNEQLNDYDEKILKLPERVAAVKTLMSELSSFNDAAWWSVDPVDLSVCDFTEAVGTLTRDQRQRFTTGEYGATRATEPLKIIRGNSLAPSFMIYVDSDNGRIDDNGRKLSRKILHWNGKAYR